MCSELHLTKSRIFEEVKLCLPSKTRIKWSHTAWPASCSFTFDAVKPYKMKQTLVKLDPIGSRSSGGYKRKLVGSKNVERNRMKATYMRAVPFAKTHIFIAINPSQKAEYRERSVNSRSWMTQCWERYHQKEPRVCSIKEMIFFCCLCGLGDLFISRVFVQIWNKRYSLIWWIHFGLTNLYSILYVVLTELLICGPNW